MNSWRDWLPYIIAGGILAALLFCLLMLTLVTEAEGQDNRPIETRKVVVPYTAINEAFPEMELRDLLRVYAIFEQLVRQINRNDDAQWETIRTPLVQYTSTQITGVSGTGTAWAVFPRAFRDTNYSVFVSISDTMHLNYNSPFLSARPHTVESVLVMEERLNVDSVLDVEILGIGLRP